MFIRSQRLFLRPAWPEDWPELLAAIADEAVVRNLARAPWPYRAEHAREFAARAQHPRTPHFVVTLPCAGGAALIGAVGLSDAGKAPAELGYWIARTHWGRGYASEAARAVLGLARALGHARLDAHQFLDNPASARVLAKCGFRATGRVAPRWSRARRGEALAAEHSIALAGADCGDAPGGGMIMRAAA